MRLLFIGGGNMGQAILGGLIAQNIPPEKFCVVEPNIDARNTIAGLGARVFSAFSSDLLDCDAIVLAVKPQMMKVAVSPLVGRLRSQVVISIAAGVDTASLARWLGTANMPYQNVVRTMPNTPALIRAGITGLHAAAGVNDLGKQLAQTLLGAVGKTVWFENESMLDVVTAVSGSGPAYVFYFIEALEQAALELGFTQADARLFASQTFLGGAQLAAASSESPGVLRARVTSKRGTTESAIGTFDKHELKQAFIDGVKAACERSRQIGKELGSLPNASMDVVGGGD